MKLSALLAGLAGVTLYGDGDVEISSVCYDSRKATDGCLYVAITGLRTDGRRFAGDAVGAGAAAVASEGAVEIPPRVPRIEVQDSRKFMAQVSARITDYPDRKMRIIGVTGTNGKTTFTYLTESIHQAAGIKTGIVGTTGVYDGQEWLKLSHTTPESADLWNILKGLHEDDIQCVAMEISSHAIALKRVFGLDIDVAVFTNLTQDHLDFHDNMEDYKQVKFSMFDQLKQTGVSIINIDDPSGRELAERIEDREVLTYSIKDREADLWVETEEISLSGSAVVIHYKGLALPVFINLPGHHNVANVAAAVCAALASDIEPEAVRAGIQNVKCIPGRMEPVPNSKGFFIFVDYAHSPDALDNLIKAARSLAPKRVVTLFGCGGDRDRDKRPKMGRIASELSDFVFVTSDNPRTENPDDIIAHILTGVSTDAKSIIPDRRQAIFEAVRFLESGDVLLVAGKGHEDYQILGTEKIRFDDREVVKEALNALP